MNQTNIDKPPVEIDLTLREDLLPVFSGLLGGGFGIQITTGKSIKSILCDQLDIAPDYLEERIQTIFMDGQVVDDVDSVLVGKGAEIALSGAMPGLVGATLRKGGHLAPMRASISRKAEEMASGGGTGPVKIKLFNLTARELGPGFLEKGVELDGADLADLLGKMPARFFRGIRSARINGGDISPDELSAYVKGEPGVQLRVKKSD